ncbi:MAG: hypothetical protein HWD58_01140 [Bacteroidota bacterium]|nr:MAG: hypothetical protein HWD58_01140 [Bacteroidota bacterium]
MSKQVAIVVPVFNPKADWLVVLLDRYHELKTFLNHLDFNLHIVNDGSGPAIEVSHLRQLFRNIQIFFCIPILKIRERLCTALWHPAHPTANNHLYGCGFAL